MIYNKQVFINPSHSLRVAFLFCRIMKYNAERVILINPTPLDENVVIKDYNDELEIPRMELEEQVNNLLQKFKEKYKLIGVYFSDEKVDIIIDAVNSKY